jgi:hypothetical protein
VQAGDVLVLAATNRDATADPSVTDNDAGGNTWTKIKNQNAATNGAGTLWTKRVTSGTASKTITVSGMTGSMSCVLVYYRGCSAGSVFANPAVGESNASGDESQAAYTTVAGGSWVIHTVHVTSNDTLNPGNRTATSPASIPEVAEHASSGGNDCSTSYAAASKPAAGSTGTISWAMTDGTCASIVVEMYADQGAALTNTLAAATVSSGATAAVQGSLSGTLGAATLAGAGAAEVQGTLSSTLGAATVAGAGVAAVQGALSKTFDAATVSGAGVVETLIFGDLDVALAPATTQAAGAVAVQGAAAVSCAVASVSASGTAPIQGTLTHALDAASGSGAGAVLVQGTGAVSLGPAALAGAASVTVVGALSSTFASASVAGAASSLAQGTLSSTLDAATLDANGGAEVAEAEGDLDTLLDAAALEGVATVPVRGWLYVGQAGGLADATLEGAAVAEVSAELDVALEAAILRTLSVSHRTERPMIVRFPTRIGYAYRKGR